jgi:hypothetical protein
VGGDGGSWTPEPVEHAACTACTAGAAVGGVNGPVRTRSGPFA